MPKASTHDALFEIYSTRQDEGLHPYLAGLFPKFLSIYHYLGTANSCPNGGPGIVYGMWDFECDGGTSLVRDVVWGTPQIPVRTALYRFYDHHGTLLYIGIAEDPQRRRSEHASRKPWWSEVAKQSIEWHATRGHALAAEAAAIRDEHPRHNVTHNRRHAA